MRLQAFMEKLRYRTGQGMVEYALILAIVAVLVIVVLVALGTQYKNMYSTIQAGLGQG